MPAALPAKDARLEVRVDRATQELVTQAAALLRTTKSAFVSSAARREAERVLARADVTLMDPAVFDSMMASLDQPDEAPEFADKLSRLPPAVTR
ncbi:MAG: DUF1778 domain-containing protein [Bifidobacteriaceae bacterium]|jgi:uncharacterized protein (DUF1778 family)|nr:DUF1778 domain-containing protein [Bifidobacteriaceae bacterium]